MLVLLPSILFGEEDAMKCEMKPDEEGHTIILTPESEADRASILFAITRGGPRLVLSGGGGVEMPCATLEFPFPEEKVGEKESPPGC